MISKKDVEHVARLARLTIAKKEEERLAKDLSSILDYIDKLKEVDISKVRPTSHSIEMENVTRDDRKRAKNEKPKSLLDLAPETKEGHLKVKPIL